MPPGEKGNNFALVVNRKVKIINRKVKIINRKVKITKKDASSLDEQNFH